MGTRRSFLRTLAGSLPAVPLLPSLFTRRGPENPVDVVEDVVREAGYDVDRESFDRARAHLDERYTGAGAIDYGLSGRILLDGEDRVDLGPWKLFEETEWLDASYIDESGRIVEEAAPGLRSYYLDVSEAICYPEARPRPDIYGPMIASKTLRVELDSRHRGGRWGADGVVLDLVYEPIDVSSLSSDGGRELADSYVLRIVLRGPPEPI